MIRRLVYAAALFCSLHSHHHAPHGAHVDVSLLLGHANPQRAIARS